MFFILPVIARALLSGAGNLAARSIAGGALGPGLATRLLTPPQPPTPQQAAIGRLGGQLANISEQAATLPARLRDMGKALLDSQQKIVQYNGAMRDASMRLETDRIARDIKTGRMTQESYTDAAKSQNRLENAAQPWEVWFTNLSNQIQSGLSDAASTLIEDFNGSIVGQTILRLGDAADQKPTQESFLNGLALELAAQNGPKRNAPPQDGRGKF